MCRFISALVLVCAAAIAAPAPVANTLPIVFEPNLGQADPGVRFVSRYGAHTLLLAADEAALLVSPPKSRRTPGQARLDAAKPTLIRMRFPGAFPATPQSAGPLPGQTSYFLGSTAPLRVPQFEHVRYHALYPGIDLDFHGTNGHLEHDFIVAAGSNPAVIRIAFPGAQTSLLPDGDLQVRSGRAKVLEKHPVIYQESAAGRKPIRGRYRRYSRTEFGFEIDAYDRSLPLIIDPESIVNVAYVGGSADDSLASVAADISDNIYGTGETASAAFLTVNRLTPDAGARPNAFVVKLDPTMSRVIWTAIIGGNGIDLGLRIFVDASGRPTVVGYSESTDFPVVNAFQPRSNGNGDVVLFRLNAQGTALDFSTYFGGSGTEIPTGLTVDPQSNLFFCGVTSSRDLLRMAGTPAQPSFGGVVDGYVAEFSQSGAFLAGTYMGGSAPDECMGIAYSSGSLFVTGVTLSPNFPVTANAWQKSLAGPQNAYVTQLTSSLSQFLFSSLFGGNGSEEARYITASPMMDVVIGGDTTSQSQFPAVSGFPLTYHGGRDGFFGVFQFNPALYPNPVLLQTGLVGGPQQDFIYTGAPVISPGGSIFGMRFFAQTDSAIPSTLKGFGNCSLPGSMLFIDIPLFTGDVKQGCMGQGIFEDAFYYRNDPDQDVLLAADVDRATLPPTGPFNYGGGTDGLILAKRGFEDPARFDGFLGVNQLSYLYPNARQPNSAAGRLWINVPGISALLKQPFGYVNLMIPGLGWVGQNLRFDTNEGIDFLSTPIVLQDPNLPNAPLHSVKAMIQITPDPIVTFDSTVASVVMPVTPLGQNFQCLTPVSQPPPTKAPGAGVNFTPGGETFSHVLARSDINVQAADSQCGPMAVANSLAYLASQNDNLKLPHNHVPGLKGDNSLVGQLDTAMNRPVTSRTQGVGVLEGPLLTGKFLYLKNNSLDGKLVNKFQGTANGSSSDLTGSGITATNQGANVTFDWLCQEIQNGEDVELAYRWSNGGHVVRVFGCGKTRGAPWIKILDDGLQTSQGDPNDTLGLETLQVWVADLTGNGQLNFDSVAYHIDFAASESLTPALKAAPGASPLTFRDALANGASFVKNYVTKGAAAALFGLFQAAASSGNQAPRDAEVPREAGDLATDIGGTEVLINGKPAPLYFVTTSQINFQVPADLAPGEATIVVKQGAKQSAAFTATIGATAPGIFLIDPSIAGANRGAIQNQDSSLNTPSNPAKPGQAIVVYVTGLGATDVPVASGQPSPATPAKAIAKVTATIGGQNASVFFAGLTPGFVGLGQVNMFVPDLAPGEYPVVITADTAQSNSALVSVGK